MTLTEFLLTANADDAIALSDWQAIPTTETVYMVTSTMNALLAQDKLKIPFKKAATDSTHPFQDYADVFVDATRQPTDFNFNPNSTMGAAVVSMLNEMAIGPFLVDGIEYSEAIGELKDLLVFLGSKVAYKNAGATIEQVKAIRYPALLTNCVHAGGQDFLVSISNKDLFSFITETFTEIPNFSVTMYWRESATEVWKKYQTPLNLTGGNGNLSQVIRKPNGISTARHFKFEFTPKYVGLINSVSVSVGQ
jgi:hypothetical protein